MLKNLKELQFKRIKRKTFSFLMNKMIKKGKRKEEKKEVTKRKILILKTNRLKWKMLNNKQNRKKYNLINQMMIEKIKKETTRKVKIKKMNLQINKIFKLKYKRKSLIRVKNRPIVMSKFNNKKKFKKDQKLRNLNKLNKEVKVQLIAILWTNILNKLFLTS